MNARQMARRKFVCWSDIQHCDQAVLGAAQKFFARQGFHIIAAFDSAPDKIGRTVGGIAVEDMADVEKRVKEESIQLVILAVPEPSAADVARRLGNAGVKSILSFAPCELTMPDNVNVTCVDLSVAMARLVYHSYFEKKNGSDDKTGLGRKTVGTTT